MKLPSTKSCSFIWLPNKSSRLASLTPFSNNCLKRRQKEKKTFSYFIVRRNMKNRFPFYRIFMFSFALNIVHERSDERDGKCVLINWIPFNTLSASKLLGIFVCFSSSLLRFFFVRSAWMPQQEKRSDECKRKHDKRKILHDMFCLLHEKLFPLSFYLELILFALTTHKLYHH